MSPLPPSGSPIHRRVLRILLRLYPRGFRDGFEDQWLAFVAEQRKEKRYRIPVLGAVRFWRDILRDMVPSFLAAWKEEKRDGSSSFEMRPPAMESIALDLRFAVRTLCRRPLFALLVVGTLGLGIGAATSMFSVVDEVLLSGSPIRDPERVMSIWQSIEDRSGFTEAGETRLAYEQYEALAREGTVFERVAVYAADWGETSLTGGPRPELVNVGAATSSLLPVLGVTPVLGRWFAPEEEGRSVGDRAMVTVLSHEHWVDRYGGDREILGRDVILNGRPYTVVGILPPGFRMQWMSASLIRAPDPGPREYWVPIGSPGWVPSAEASIFEAVGRLAPGITPAAAVQETTTILDDSWPWYSITAVIIPRLSDERRGISSPFLLLFGATGLLLLIACGNVAALSLGELQRRVHEVATRSAMGAGRGRIFRQLMTESLLLGVLGSFLGSAVAVVGTRGLVALAPPTPRMEFVSVDLRVLAFSAIVGILSGVFFGAIPAMVMARKAAGPILKGAGRTALRGGGQWGRMVLVGEVGLTVLLLVGAGLFVRSLGQLGEAELGFRPERLAAIEVGISREKYPDRESASVFMDGVLREIEEIPGVEEVSAASALPFPGRTADWASRLHPDDSTYVMSRGFQVAPGYLEFMKIPILEGRGFLSSDGVDDPPVVVVGESLARALWGDRSPVGQEMSFPAGRVRVVGVAGDVRQASMENAPPLTFYSPFSQLRRPTLAFVARGSLPEAGLVTAMREALWRVDSEVAVMKSGTVSSFIHESAREARYRTSLLGTFATLATLIAVVGIMGGTAHQVAQRTREVGIRKALGAEDGNLLWGVVRGAVAIGVLGTGIGLLIAFWAAPVLATFLFGVETFDPLTYGGTAALFLVACALAGYLPARRILTVDPVRVLAEK